MTRSRIQKMSCIPALVGLLALLVLPTLHGPLGHYLAESPCAEGSQEACVEKRESSHAAASSGDVCSICAVSARGRVALPAPVTLEAPPAPPLHQRPAEESRLHGVATWAPAAPRAPPAFV